MIKKNFKRLYKFIKVKIKRNTSNISAIKKFRHKNWLRENERNKKAHNFILADDFIKEHNQGKKIEKVEGYYIHLYEFSNTYIACCNNCAFVQKIENNKLYTFKESAGLIGRLDEPGMQYAPPYDLAKVPIIEEDEVCMLCFLLGENYWHYTFDIIPRLMVMMRRGYKGKFLINDTRCAHEFMELLSIPPERLIINKCGTVIHAKNVYLFSEMYGIELRENLLAATRTYIMEQAEEKYGALEDKTYPKRIYVTRVSRRKIINETEIINYLRTKGFEIVIPENLTIYQQMKLFHNAEIIVTPHGANSTNVLYAQAKTSFVECFGHMWINPCMINTIDMLNLDYHMVCERLADYDDNAHKYSDYVINLLILDCKIRNILEQREKNT